MKKLSTLLFLLAVFSYTVNGQGSFTSFKSSANGVAKTKAAGISPDGKYVTGTTYNSDNLAKHMFTWTVTDNLKEWDAGNENVMGEGSMGFSISNIGMVSGIAPNPDITAYADAEYENGEPVYAAVRTAALVTEGETSWSFLPTLSGRKNGGYSYGYGDYVYASAERYGYVTATGGIPVEGKYTAKIPVVWQFSTSEPNAKDLLKLTLPAGFTSGEGRSISGSIPTIIAGWVGVGNLSNIPAIWKENLTTGMFDFVPINDLKGGGNATGVSNNGNYVVMNVNDRGVLYDMTKEVSIYLQTTHDANGCYPLAVSDNGIVVGHTGGKPYMGNPTPSTAFIYTEKMGLKKLSDFLREAGIDYTGTLEAVTGISADGTKLVGYAGGNSFYVEIPAITEGAYPARGISLENKKYGEVTVTWTAAPDDAANPRTGYKVYHNGTLLETVAADATSYIHAGVADGEHKYYVTAVYGDTESRPTATASTMMAKAEFPFYDAFNTYGDGAYGRPDIPLTTGGWDVSWNTVATMKDSWVPSIGGFYQLCMFFWTPIAGTYSEYVASPYFDLSDAEDAKLRFAISIFGNSANNTSEFLAIEAFDGQEWVAVDTIRANTTASVELNYVHYEVDLTEQLAGNANARFRIVAFGDATETGGDINWRIDNLDFYDTKRGFKTEPVAALSANEWINENDGSKVVYVNWSDPSGYARLRYETTAFGENGWGAKIGNEGTPFIAANMYPAEELKIHEGAKLTSISFMPTCNIDIFPTVDATYKWFVSQGGERLFSEDVTGDLTSLEYKTIELENPIAIDVNKPLYYGVEVVSHHMDDYPIATTDVFHYVPDIHPGTGQPTGMFWATSYNVADGRANIYSEDGGKTWKKIGSYTGDGGTEVYQLFCIRAEIKQDPSKELYDRVMGYTVYRNGKNIYRETFEDARLLAKLNTFIDPNPLIDEEATYQVEVQYATLDYSDAKEAKILITSEGIGEENVNANGFITVTPTLAVNYVNIDGEFVKATMYDVNGKVVVETSNNQINVNSLPAGTYIVKVSTSKGEVTKKIIVKK
ncbi:hypothetical protein M2132_002357 [Dysgonomonas sp. PH5-45]|uniref:T9SS type A sorting domain-containing protein n=1 Tax=unclassified Dysgonomonas TaxID=2630389 RepID=UPI00247389A8|nr:MULTISPECIES: T9SS type A sorting domain-containing protein [unclassified Dysgonomonas]MDH6356005.1 hypothetical protein [Dysgonomonas sp. PH5-45]MDH6388898.1 hypothetical protein [Dysgonomonas sp. PH5-37]